MADAALVTRVVLIVDWGANRAFCDAARTRQVPDGYTADLRGEVHHRPEIIQEIS